MARADATCTCATCGKTFTVTVFRRNRKEADSFEAWAAENIDECGECEAARIAKEHEAENEKSAAAAAEKGWPELTGSPKQVAWAVTIRENEMPQILEKVEQARFSEHRMQDGHDLYEENILAVNEILAEKRASWWIDHRGHIERAVIMKFYEIHENPDSFRAEKYAKDDEATIAKPEEVRFKGVADIKVSDDKISVSFDKNEDFRSVVKALGYRWNSVMSAWVLTLGHAYSDAAERAAELGNKLLNAGFSIRIQDAETLRKAVAGEYAPACTRWVSHAAGKECFMISWARDDDFYYKAKRLPGAKYDSPDILVPDREWAAVKEFARANGFRLTPDAQAALDRMEGTTVTVQPAAARQYQYEEHPVSEVLESSREIIDDLRDDDDV